VRRWYYLRTHYFRAHLSLHPRNDPQKRHRPDTPEPFWPILRFRSPIRSSASSAYHLFWKRFQGGPPGHSPGLAAFRSFPVDANQTISEAHTRAHGVEGNPRPEKRVDHNPGSAARSPTGQNDNPASSNQRPGKLPNPYWYVHNLPDRDLHSTRIFPQ